MATKILPKGFVPNGTGPKGARYGREPSSNLAYKSDGTVRAARRTFSAMEQLARVNDAKRLAMSGIGRQIVRDLTGLEAFRGSIGTFRRWIRDAKAYGSPESIAERKRYFQAMLDAVDAKSKASAAWLPTASGAIEAVSGLYEKVGAAFEAFNAEHKRMPNDKEMADIVQRFLTPKVRAIVESASNPDNDPFAAFRRDAGDIDAGGDEDEDEDTAGEDEDEDED